MNRIITLTTDFGERDGFVGAMKGVILSINPNVTIVDITHEIAPQDVEQGAFLFAASAKYFPANSIHVAVVDPGVGSERRAIAMQMGESIFVGPDNGVLSFAIQNSPFKNQAIHLNQPKYWLEKISNTFHGRDIFAPVAGYLSLGTPLDELGEPIKDWVTLPHIFPTQRGTSSWVGRVMHIDQFGNIITNIGAALLAHADPRMIVVQIGRKKIAGVKKTYAEGVDGELIALIGSSWLLEIAQRNGNAAKTLGILRGAKVVVWV